MQIEGLDEAKLEEYLEKNKITSMKGKVDDNNGNSAATKTKGRKPRTFKKHNEHLAGVLNEFNPELTTTRPKK